MTPEERAEMALSQVIKDWGPYSLPAEEVLPAVARAIRAAEAAMSRYWDMTVGQECNELREENAKMMDILQQLGVHDISEVKFEIEGN
jgi:hypothetical protein